MTRSIRLRYCRDEAKVRRRCRTVCSYVRSGMVARVAVLIIQATMCNRAAWQAQDDWLSSVDHPPLPRISLDARVPDLGTEDKNVERVGWFLWRTTDEPFAIGTLWRPCLSRHLNDEWTKTLPTLKKNRKKKPKTITIMR